MPGLDTKNKNVLVHLVYIARSMCHSLLQQLSIPSLPTQLHKTCVHTYVYEPCPGAFTQAVNCGMGRFVFRVCSEAHSHTHASFSSMPWCTRLHCLTPHKPLTCQGPDEVWLLYEGYYSARGAAWWFDNRREVWTWRPDCWEGWHRACFDNLRDELNKSLEERTVSEHELVFFRRRLELPHWA